MRKKLFGLFVGVTAAASMANADMIQFASVTPTGTAVYQWRNTGNTCSGGGCLFHTGTSGTTAGVPVHFLFQNTYLPALMQNSQDAVMTINAPTVDGLETQVVTVFGTSFLFQPLGPNATLSILRAPCIGLIDCGSAAFAGKTNLLSAVFTGQLSGTAGSANSGLGADSGLFGQSVAFTSDFLDFSGQTGGTLSFSFTALTPVLGVEKNGKRHMLTWRGGGTGEFSSDPGFAIHAPEPSSLIFSGIGSVLILAGMLRKRLSSQSPTQR